MTATHDMSCILQTISNNVKIINNDGRKSPKIMRIQNLIIIQIIMEI